MSRRVLFGTIAGILLALVTWFFLLFTPESHHLSNLKNQQATLQSSQAGLEARLTALKREQQQQPAREQQLQNLKLDIPPTSDIAGFINQMNALASSTGVTLISLAPSLPSSTSASAPYLTINVSAQVQGTYSQTISFLDGLYQMSRLVVVDGISVNVGGSATGPSSSANLTTNFKLRMFTTAQPTAALK